MKGKLAFLLLLTLLFIAGCNVLPQNAPYEQAANPQFTPAPGTYNTNSVQITITSDTPGASIFYTTDGSIPVELQAWLESIEGLKTEISTSVACGTIFHRLNATVIDDLNNWIVEANIGASQGQISQQDLNNCQLFFANIPQGSPVDLATILASIDTQVISSCNKVFLFLDTLVAADFQGWSDILETQVTPAQITECSDIFAEVNAAATGALSTLLYVDSFVIQESATVRAIAYLDNMWPSDIVRADYTINGGPVNQPPLVTLTEPTTGSSYTVGDPITVSATASDTDGTIVWVEFWADTIILGQATTSPYTLTWNGAAAGSYSITAKAYDDLGASTTSSASSITVNEIIGNQPPTVTLTEPMTGSSFDEGDPITVTATASDSDGTVAWVEFWAGTTFIGQAESSPYTKIWNGAVAGSHNVTAIAYDNLGASTTSSAASITITALPPDNNPPTAEITSPQDGDVIPVGDIDIVASVSDSDGTVDKVEFFRDGTIPLGILTSAPWQITWANVGAGTFDLTIKATDDVGASTVSNIVSITVNTSQPNLHPVVALSGPSMGATFSENDIVTFAATASDADGTIVKVEFLLNGSVVGSDTSEPFSYNWIAVEGYWIVTAKAYDDSDANTVSDWVSITVSGSGSDPYCGDGTCNGVETVVTCSEDCTVPPPAPYCGDGICNGIETYQTCTQDCENPNTGGGGGGGGGRSRSPPDDEVNDTGPSNTIKTVVRTARTTTTTTDTNTQIPPDPQQGAQEFDSSSEGSKGFGLWWLWLLILIIIIAAVIFFFVMKNRSEERLENPGIPQESLRQCGEYMRKMKIMGKTQEQIKTKMKVGGWTEEQLKYIFSKFT